MAKTFSHLQPRPVQFRLWWLLVVTTVVAVAAAVGAPFLRGYETLELLLRLSCGIACVVLQALGFWLGCRRAWKLPTDSGKIIFVLPGCRYHPDQRMRHPTRVIVFVLVGLGAFVSGFKLFQPAIFQAPVWLMLYGTLLCLAYGYMLGMAASSRANYPLAICDAGISLGRTFVYWDEIFIAKWLPECPNVLALLLGRDLGRIYLEVAAEERDAVEMFVRAKTKFRD